MDSEVSILTRIRTCVATESCFACKVYSSDCCTRSVLQAAADKIEELETKLNAKYQVTDNYIAIPLRSVPSDDSKLKFEAIMSREVFVEAYNKYVLGHTCAESK